VHVTVTGARPLQIILYGDCSVENGIVELPALVPFQVEKLRPSPAVNDAIALVPQE
jgi:hypothetical protein